MASLPVTAGSPATAGLCWDDAWVDESERDTVYAELVRQANLVGTRVRVSPPWLTHGLRVAADQHWSTAILHPLGFMCIPLRRSPGLGACVHVWSRQAPAARPTTSQIHCHSWDLHSVVLWGELRNQLIRVRRSVR
ncbi:MAG: hypothetical protein ACQSGP_21965, partial [Frankia sp.]